MKKVLKSVFFLSMLVFITTGCSTANITAPEMSVEEQNLAIESIKENPDIVDAGIAQENDTISLSLIVSEATDTEKAKELGDSFIRVVKTFSQDEQPSEAIGSGIYNYIISIGYQNKPDTIIGAKAKISENITW